MHPTSASTRSAGTAHRNLIPGYRHYGGDQLRQTTYNHSAPIPSAALRGPRQVLYHPQKARQAYSMPLLRDHFPISLDPGEPRASVELGIIYLVRECNAEAGRLARAALRRLVIGERTRKRLLHILEEAGK